MIDKITEVKYNEESLHVLGVMMVDAQIGLLSKRLAMALRWLFLVQDVTPGVPQEDRWINEMDQLLTTSTSLPCRSLADC